MCKITQDLSLYTHGGGGGGGNSKHNEENY